MSDKDLPLKFESHYEVLKQLGGRIGTHPDMIKDHLVKLGIDLDDPLAVSGPFENAADKAEGGSRW